MPYLRLATLLVLLLIGCEQGRHSDTSQAFVHCDSEYPVSGLYFDSNHDLRFNVRFVKVVTDPDSAEFTDKEYEDIAAGIALANEIFDVGKISFQVIGYTTYVDSYYSGTMRDFHIIARSNNVPKTINVYVFPTHSSSAIYGLAGGVPSLYIGVLSNFVKTSVLAHELGHALGLHHVHNFDSSFDGYNIQTGDLVCDTPKSQPISGEVDGDCEYTGSQDLTNAEVELLVCNIMSYSHLECRACITPGQTNRIRFIVDQSLDLRNAVSNLPTFQDILY